MQLDIRMTLLLVVKNLLKGELASLAGFSLVLMTDDD